MARSVTFDEIVATLDARIHTSRAESDRIVESACASDLMSDVLAYSRPRSILITGLCSPQTIRTAEVADVRVVCLVFGKEPTGPMIEMAEGCDLPIISTRLSLFSASGRLYALGLGGCLETP